MLKILPARFQQYMNWELPFVPFRKSRGTRDQLANIHWIIEKAREFPKNPSTSASLTTLNLSTVCITANCGKFFKRWEYQTTWPVSQEVCMQVNKQQLELDMEQRTGSKLGKEYVKAVYCHLAYLTYTQSESEVAQSCPTLHNPRDYSLSGSSVHGIFQARVLEWIAISFSRGSSQPRNRTQVSRVAGRRFTIWATREALYAEFIMRNAGLDGAQAGMKTAGRNINSLR